MTKLSNNNRPSALKSTEQLQTYMHDLLNRAKAQGATDAEVSIEQDRGFSVDVRMKEVETVAFSDDQSITLVLYLGHQKGAASTSELTPQSLDRLVTAALDIARVSAADPCFGLADKELTSHTHPDLNLYHPWDLTPLDAITLAKQCEEAALSLDERIINSDGVNVSSYTGCFGYANTHGSQGVQYSSKHQMSCSLLAKGKDDKLQRDYDYTLSRLASELLPPELIAQQTVSRTIQRLNAKKIKTQSAPVLFDARVAGHLVGSFMSAISGGQLYRKQSFLLDSLEKKVFPDWFHIQEHPYILMGLGSCPFDGEGVATRNNVFVDEGCIKQYVLSSYSARRMGLQTSANAGGVHNLTVKSNAPDLASLIKTMNTGLLVTELMGDGINIQTGDYSRGASGFWVENGEIQFPVEEITIAGHLGDLYAQILHVGADVSPNRAMQCGSILVESMMIAGI
ncbi:MAG: metalloprotease PmbA [Gammaproteobacteria bacterium]|nr:metalloprotease PmbA [Gammaproteobacteria bacterium]